LNARCPIHVFIVEDHPLIVHGVSALIEQEPDIKSCGFADNCKDALRLIKDCRPDVILLDLFLGDEFALDLIISVKEFSDSIQVLVLTACDELEYARRCLQSGAVGFIQKSSDGEEVMQAIRDAASGKLVFSERAQEQMIRALGASGSRDVDLLSNRELQVFRMLGLGMTTRQIATALDRSVKTIESHRERIKRKMELETAAELTHAAIEWVVKS
jgi:DNA-binding NarL/FixJ family response regulator